MGNEKVRDRVYLPFVFSGSCPDLLKVTIEWKTKRAAADLALRAGAKGPLVSTPQSAHFFVAQPAGLPLQTHVVEVQCGRAQPIRGADGPLLILLGGFDADHAVARDANLGKGFLALMYPVDDPTAMARKIPTVQRRSK